MRTVHATSFGLRLKRLRRDHQFTLREVVRRSGISKQSLEKWESGEYLPGYDALLKLADVFGLSLDTLMRPSAEPVTPRAPFGRPPRTLTGRAIYAQLVAASAH